MGLTWALFVAGAPAQVASQWAVRDDSTAELRQRFYGGINDQQPKGEKPNGEARRKAALGLMQGGEHAHPYYWAPLILVGDWR